MKKTLRIFLSSLSLAALLAGPTIALAESSSSESSASSQESTASSESSTDFKAVAEAIKAATSAKEASVTYTNSTPITFGKAPVTETIHAYSLISLKDFTKDLAIPFGGDTQTGAVLVLDVSLKNDSDKDAYITGGFSGSIVGYNKAVSHNNNLLDETKDLTKAVVDAKQVLKAKSELRGFVTLAIGGDALKQLNKNGELSFDTLVVLANQGDKITDAIVPTASTILPTSKEGEAKRSAASKFYPDKLTAENWGTKTLISSSTDKQNVNFEGYDVTLNGYQLVDFKPNEDQASRFEKLKGGVVVLTAEITVKNNGKVALNARQTAGNLVFNDQLKLMHEGMVEVEPAKDKEIVEPGQEYTYHLAFVYSKDDYDLYKDRSLTLNVNLYDKDFKSLTKSGDITFQLKK